MHLRPGNVRNLTSDLPQAWLHYSVPGHGSPRICRLNEVAQWTDGEWILTLPYNAGLSVRLRREIINGEGRRGKFLLLPHPGTLLDQQRVSVPPGMQVIPVQDMTIEGMTRWFLTIGTLQPILEVDASESDAAAFVLPAAGPHVAGWMDSIGDSVFEPVDLAPGETVNLDLDERSRPVLRGILLDWHGSPVPKARLTLVTSLDLVEYDHMPQDPHALVTYRRDGQFYRTAQKTYQTDENGLFEYRVPRGKDYAIWSHALGGYCFWSTQQSGLPLSENEEIVLHLLDHSLGNSTIFQFFGSDGLPFPDATITVAVAGDVPFFRAWPYKLPLDERGELRLIGLEPGTLVGVFVYLQGDDWLNPFYRPPYPTIPDSRRVEIHLPDEVLRKKTH